MAPEQNVFHFKLKKTLDKHMIEIVDFLSRDYYAIISLNQLAFNELKMLKDYTQKSYPSYEFDWRTKNKLLIWKK